MTIPKYIFIQFNGRFVKGLCLFGSNEIIKMYGSQAMAEKTVAKIQEMGINCKAVKNHKKWAIIVD